jgi:hypothetical protein
MFTLLRSVVIVGLIFYFSPTRENGYLQHKSSGEERRPAPADAPRPSASLEIQDGALNRFVGSLKEEVVRAAVNEKTLTAGLRATAAQALMEASVKPEATEKARSSDQDTALRGGIDPSVRCVYRCDGSE